MNVIRGWRVFGCPVVIVAVVGALAQAQAAASQPAPLKGEALRAAVREALSVARKQPVPDPAVLKNVARLYRIVVADTSLPYQQRDALRLALQGRLKSWQAGLQEQVRAAVPAKPQPAADLPGQILAQQAPPGGPGQPPATAQPPIDHSQELLDVIQDTISPESWDIRGGPGVIRYWPPGHALIVRQTGEVHEQLGQLLGDLRQ